MKELRSTILENENEFFFSNLRTIFQVSVYCGSWFEHVLGYEQLARTINNNILIVQYEQMINDFDNEACYYYLFYCGDFF